MTGLVLSQRGIIRTDERQLRAVFGNAAGSFVSGRNADICFNPAPTSL